MRLDFAAKGFRRNNGIFTIVTMRILIFASHPPAAPGEVGCPRLYSFMSYLAEHHEIGFACLEPRNALEIARFEAVSSVTSESYKLTPSAPPSKWRRYLHTALLKSNLDPSIRYRNYLPEFRAEAQSISSSFRPDVVLIAGLGMEAMLPQNLGCPTVVDLVDSLSLLFARKVEFRETLKSKLAYYVESRRLRQLEASAIRRRDGVVVISDVDAGVLQKLAPSGSPIDIISNGISTDWFEAVDTSSECSFDLVFSGVMNYAPNEDAACYLAEEIYPLIRQKHSNVKLCIAGAGPTERVLQLASIAGVSVTGEVSDLRPYVAGAKIYVSPLRFGAGVKNKILAAMAMRRAIVASPVSVEGLRVSGDRELVVADSIESYVEKIHLLLASPELRDELGRNGRNLAKKDYSWKSAGGRLEEVFARVCER